MSDTNHYYEAQLELETASQFEEHGLEQEATTHAALAQAHATLALADAVRATSSDTEPALNRTTEALYHLADKR